jgi:hypothetical protein
MKLFTLANSLKFALIIFLIVCCRESSVDTSLFTVEDINGVRHIHNISPQLGDSSPVRLELLGSIGKLESEDEKDILFDPVDAARLPNGDILILEGRGCTVRRYDKDYHYMSSFGQPGEGPGDLNYPHAITVKDNDLYLASRRVSKFTPDGKYEGGFRPPVTKRFGSFGAQYRTSGMEVLSGSRVVLPSHPSAWLNEGKHKLLSVYDRGGAMLYSFGTFKQYETPELTLNANIVYFAADGSDNLYVCYAHQNVVAKYSPEGELVFSSDRPLRYEIQNMMTVEVMRSGALEREFPWPSVSSVSMGIHVDHENRIWVLTYLKQPNRFLTFEEGESLTDCYEFDVFDSGGILLFRVPFPNVRFTTFSMCGDRLYLIDAAAESCVYEYRIEDQF